MPQKGQKVKESTKQRSRETKQKTMKSKFDWTIVEPYLDVSMDNGSANRIKPHITFREFKQAMENGKSMRQLRNEGISKHLLKFMSSFCKGNICLTKYQFEKDYLKGFSLDEIADKYNIQRSHVTFLRQLYDIDRKGWKYIRRKETEELLTQRQKDIIAGSLMGDAKKVSPSAVGFIHGGKQKEYLNWKYNELENIASKYSLKFETVYDNRYDSENISCRFYTHANSDVEKIVSKFYPDGDKQISHEVLELISPLGIAVWFMDDGNIGNNHTLKKYNNATPSYQFCTDSFDYDSVSNICEWFNEIYNIKSRIKERGLTKDGFQMKYRVIIENESAQDFVNLIQPYILPMFEYKIRSN